VISYIIFIVVIAFIFDFINGFHDSANSIATIVGTRVLTPFKAVAWAAFFNFIALFAIGTHVARTIGSGMIDVAIVDPNVVLAGLLGAIVWDLITWYYGIPSSSSHALIGGYAGAAVAKAGLAAITWGAKWISTLAFIVLSPLLGMLLGSSLMVIVAWLFHRVPAGKVNRYFRHLQLASSAAFSLSHGANDAQKTMGIIVGLLLATQTLFASEPGFLRHFHLTNPDHIPMWIKLGAHIAIALGTLFGGWRIVHTMGTRVTRLRPIGGFAAETGGALSVLLATRFGIPVSTTHTITGSIVGVGATMRPRGVRWGLARRIVWAWVLTIPASALTAALCYWLLATTNPMPSTAP
jgi:inorganic phosphate transporter, PiT family